MSGGTCGLTSSFVTLGFCRVNAGTIDITDIATAEHVTIACGQTLVGTHFTTMDVYLRLSEYVTVHVERTLLAVAKEVIAFTTTKHIMHHMAVVHLYHGLTSLVEAFQGTYRIGGTTGFDGTTADGGNLTTTVHTIADGSVPYRNMTEVDTTFHIVTTTEKISAVPQTVGTFPHIVFPIRIIMDLFLITLHSRPSSIYNLTLLVLHLTSIQVDIADIAIVDGQVGRAINSTALTAAVGITLDGRHTGIEAIFTLGGIVFAQDLIQLCDKILIRLVWSDTNDHVTFARSLIVLIEGGTLPVCADFHRRMA